MGRQARPLRSVTAAAVAALAGVLLFATSSSAHRSDAAGIQGPADGTVLPSTSTVLLEYQEPWFCADCEGTVTMKVATDPQFTNVVDGGTATCPAGGEPTCPYFIILDPFRPGKYYWAEFVTFANGEEHKSDTWSFTVVDPRQISQSGAFPDAVGDSTTARDVTGVQVNYDPPTGQIRFTASIPGFRSIAKDEKFILAIDTDQDGTTGSLDSYGADWYIVIRGSNNTYGVYTWDGSQWVYKPTPIQVLYRDGILITMNRSELGGASTEGFNFWFASEKVVGEDTVWDLAPDASVWNYQLPAATQTVTTPTSPQAPAAVKSLTVKTLPLTPTAGLKFRIVPRVVLTTGAVVTPERLGCKSSIAGKPLRGASCTITVPATAAGKQLVVDVVALYKGSTASKTLRYKIRRG